MADFPDDRDTRLCNNCSKEIPVFNFTIHEIHCLRNIGVCPICKEPLPKSDMEIHMAAEHCQVVCKCNKKLEKRQLKKHEETECPLRLALCQHCDLELAVLKLKEHEEYCGARTEPCSSCGRNVLVKDLKTHPAVCGREEMGKRNATAIPPNAYDEAWGQDRIWMASQLLRQIESLDPPARLPQRTLRAFESDPVHSRTSSQRNGPAHCPIQNNLFEEQERQERSRSQQPPPQSGEDSANLDFMLALSLQNEGQASALAEEDFWQAVCEAGQLHSGPGSLSDIQGAAGETMLPCEFCEELYPEELLIDHQTSCNPSRALPSLSTGSSSSREVEEPGDIFQNILQQATYDQLGFISGLNTLSPMEGSIIIPCEFCGVQLEEEVLFHHQDQCDQRPATAPTQGSEGIRKQDPEWQEASPERPRRRSRHQGDPSSGYMEDIKPGTAKGSAYPLPPSRPTNNMTATCNRLLKSTSGPTAGYQPSPPRVLRLNDADHQSLQGRSWSSQNGAVVTGHSSAIHSIRNLCPENLAAGGYGASGRSDGGRSSRAPPTAANYRTRGAKAKPKPPKQQGAGDAEEEEE
ncbi:TRAF-type zinc finger domain-containing protein 1 isoform 1-T3 [Thomomys bottae]